MVFWTLLIKHFSTPAELMFSKTVKYQHLAHVGCQIKEVHSELTCTHS